jgi:threonyl-tRNA synthetase
MIHCAIMGSIERFLSILIEHTGGNFPLWLSPEQIRILPVAGAHHEYAGHVFEELKAVGVRVTLDDSKETLGKRIRGAKQDRLPYFIVIGDKEVEAKEVTLESRNGASKQMSVNALANHLLTEIETKTIT